jgi:ABC-type uncharacterized transport system substrate-binding protein
MVGILAGGPAAAHPHAWFDVAVEVLFTADGRIAALRETWLLDEFYTAFATEGTETGPDGRPSQQTLDDILHENMTNLADYGYFTEIRSGGALVDTAAPREMATRLDGDRIRMQFVLPMASPVAPPVVYAVFDPTFYIDMTHKEGTGSIRLVGAPEGCTVRLEHPQPTFDEIMLAASLDQTATSDDTLGILFAEKAEVSCP